jgi:hypothetical protein
MKCTNGVGQGIEGANVNVTPIKDYDVVWQCTMVENDTKLCQIFGSDWKYVFRSKLKLNLVLHGDIVLVMDVAIFNV